MKILVIFRGIIERHKRGVYNSALHCTNNWRYTGLLDHDTAFVTYESPCLEELKMKLLPKFVNVIPCISASDCFSNVIDLIKKQINNYDRFVILRFDFMYRRHLTTWPKWPERGLIVVNRDVTWPSKSLYSDQVFILDSNDIENFSRAWMWALTQYREDGSHTHCIAKYYYENNLPFHLMYETYHHMENGHPLYSPVALCPEPDLKNPIDAIVIEDVSRWN
jgi:hypothetical protein